MTGLNHEFFEQVRQEHQELRELLGKVHHVLTERTESPETVHSLLRELTQHVDKHFADEEQSGFFENIVSEAPRYAERAETLKQEHDSLRAQLARINELVQAGGGDDGWWKSLSDDVHEFSKLLMHHESQENELLQDVYDEDMGSKD